MGGELLLEYLASALWSALLGMRLTGEVSRYCEDN